MATCWPVIAQLLVGARDEEAYSRLSGLLQALPRVSIGEAAWEGAAKLGHTMRRRGFAIPLADLLIAQAAMLNNVELWHVDTHYEEVRRFSSLRTKSFLAAIP